MPNGSWPGTCAPSTIASAPASRAAAQTSATGRTSAVGEVMWLSETTRVRGPIARTRSSGSASTSFAPTNSHVRWTAPYWFGVVSTSSPGSNRSERITAFSPVVAFGTKTRSSDRAPTNDCERRARVPDQLLEAAREKLHRVALDSRCHAW